MSVPTIGEPRTASPWPEPDESPAYDPRPRHLRVVDNKQLAAGRRRRWIRLGSGVLGALLVALVFASVGMHAMLAQNQFRLDRLNSEAARQQTKYQQLRLQVDQLESPQRIIATARTKLGMVPLGSVAFLAPSGAVSPLPPTATEADPIPAPTAPPGWSTLKPHLAARP